MGGKHGEEGRSWGRTRRIAVVHGWHGSGECRAPQNGLVNVAVRDVTILDQIGVGVAANVAAAICGVQVGPVAVLANQVEAGQPATVCTIERQTGNVPINITK